MNTAENGARTGGEGRTCITVKTDDPGEKAEYTLDFRGSLLTSRYPHHAVPGHEMQLPPRLPTVADVFRENGYRTAWFGKWHLDGLKDAENTCEHYVIPRERRGGFET